MLPFKQAIKFPFDFYGKVRFPSLKGRVVINCPVTRRMVEFGRAESEIFPSERCIISIKGDLVVNGKGNSFGSGVILEINEGAIMELNRRYSSSYSVTYIMKVRIKKLPFP